MDDHIHREKMRVENPYKRIAMEIIKHPKDTISVPRERTAYFIGQYLPDSFQVVFQNQKDKTQPFKHHNIEYSSKILDY